MIPPLRSKKDVLPFVWDLIGRPELAEVVAAFADERMPSHCDRLRTLGVAGSESNQTARVLAHWESSEVVIASGLGGDRLQDRLHWLRSLAAARWDFRLGAERDAIPTSCELLDDNTADAVYRLAHAWNMLDPAAAEGDFDHVIVLGGLIRANVNRPRAAAELLDSGAIRTGSVVGLSAHRHMSKGELELAQSIECSASTESEALAFGFEQAFGTSHDSWIPAEHPLVSRSRLASGVQLKLAVAPMNQDGTRANTGGAFDWFMNEGSNQVDLGAALLSVTTPIYWISSHAALLTRVSEGVFLTTVGAEPSGSSLPPQTFRCQHYLQEIKSALDSLQSLLEWT